MTHPSTPAADLHKFGSYADKIGHWTDGPETFVICKAKNVKLGAQTYGPPQDAATREAALIAQCDQLRAVAQKAKHFLTRTDSGPDAHDECDEICLAIDAALALSAPAVSVEGV